MYFSHLFPTTLPALIDMHTHRQEPMNLCIIRPITTSQSEMFLVLRLFVFNFSCQVSQSPKEKKKKKQNSRKQTEWKCSFECSQLISARQDLITQPGLLQSHLRTKTDWEHNFQIVQLLSFWCFYFLCLVPESEGFKGFSLSCTRWECRSCWTNLHQALLFQLSKCFEWNATRCFTDSH